MGDDKRVSCKFCHKKIWSKNIKSHIISVHQKPAVECGYCLRSFTQKSNLAKHSKRKHPGVPVIQLTTSTCQICPHCHMSLPYATASRYRTHLSICAYNPFAKERIKYQCSVCEQRFLRLWNKKEHEKRKHDLVANKGSGNSIDDNTPLDQNTMDKLTNNSLNPELLISRGQSNRKHSKRFLSDEISTTFHFSKLANKACSHGYIMPVVTNAFRHIISVTERKPNKLISVSLDSKSLDWPHTSPLQKSTEFDVSFFLNKLARILNSNQVIDLGEEMQIVTRSIELPQPKGKYITQKSVATYDEFLRRTNSTVDPNWLYRTVHLESCFVICLAMKIHIAKDRRIRQMNWYKKHRYTEAMADTVEMIYSQLDASSDTPITVLHYPLLNSLLIKHYGLQLICYQDVDGGQSPAELVYAGKSDVSGTERVTILINRDSTHCRLIIDADGLFKRDKLCHTCLKVGKLCSCPVEKICKKCDTIVCTQLIRDRDDSGLYLCDQCSLYFDSKICFKLHQIRSCQEVQKCMKCFRNVKRTSIDNEMHAAFCGKRLCKHCNEYVDFHDDDYNGHICFIKQPNKKKIQSNLRIIYLDLESTFDSQGYHQCILGVALRTCNQCCLEYDAKETDCCGTRKHVFGGEDCLEKLVKWLFFLEMHRGSKVVAQAGSFYDALILFRGLIQLGHTAKITVRGNRILTMTAGLSVTVLDAYCFFGVSLAKLAPMFGLELQKSFFPLSFLKTGQTLNYEGPVPPKSSFEPEKMTEQRKKDFDVFYDQLEQQVTYCFQTELAKYCFMDTKVLYMACTKFQQLIMSGTGINPFAVSTSIASLCVFLYRLCFMPVNEHGESRISLLPERDLRAQGLAVQSEKALKWLAWLRHTTKLPIQSALTGREPIIGNRPVDGLYMDSIQQQPNILQFHGCFVHGHSPSCPLVPEQWYINRKHPFFPNLTFGEVHERSLTLDEQLRLHGNLTVLYECELNKQLSEDRRMQDFFNAYDTTKKEPISPRKALYGGRVDCAIALIELTPEMIINGYKIGYLDFTSLYPSVMYEAQYPVGKPKIFKSTDLPNFGRDMDSNDLLKYTGLLYVKTLPPRSALHFPVLPRRANDGSLVFALCRICSEEKLVEKRCEHTDEERSWEAVYTTIEYALAIERGYQTPQVYEIWHFEEKIPCKENEPGLFEEYVKHFLKLKIISSPIPHKYGATDEGKLNFCADINKTYGFDVQPNELQRNKALRSFAKLMLNNLWGKFGQNPHTAATEVHVVKNRTQLLKLICEPKQKLVNCRLVTDDVMLAQTEKDTDLIDIVHSSSNVIISSWTTALARIKLFKAIEPIEFDVAYIDTDSIIFIYKDIMPVQTSDDLGCLKNELDENDFITKFVALGSKSYCYVTQSGKAEIKFKGLTHYSKQELCFDTMKQLLLTSVHELPNQPMHITLKDSKIRRNILEGGVLQNLPDSVKKVQYSMTKRQFVYCDFDQFRYRLFPWGWCVW